MAIKSPGTVLKIGSGTGSPETFTAVGELTGFQGPSGSAPVLDVTNLASTAKEKAMGLPDFGEFSFDMNLNYGDAGQTAMRAAHASSVKRNFKIEIPAGVANEPAGATASPATTLSFSGYVTGFRLNGAVDSVLKASATITITGPVTSAASA